MDQKQAVWETFFKDPLITMETVKQTALSGQINTQRSLYWKIYLEYLPTLEVEAWPLLLQKERQSYEDLKSKFIFDPAREHEKRQDLDLNNPLSLDADSPWTQYFKDTALQKVIHQDVERTMPDIKFFRDSAVQETMTNILFIWSKVNPDVSYRQGMHELLAPVLFVVDQDKIDQDASLDPLQRTVFDRAYVENDSFCLFSRIMRSTKPWFEVGQLSSSSLANKARSQKGGFESQGRYEKVLPIIASCRKIQNEILKVLDPELQQHLDSHNIEPQLYGLRWLRLLFGREFEFDDLLLLWDALFADDPNLGLVEWVCTALLVFLRKDMIGADYATTLHRLMKFPPKDSLNTTITEFVASAKGLRTRYNQIALQASKSNHSSQGDISQSSPSPIMVGGTAVPRRGSSAPWVQHTSTKTQSRTVPSPVTAETHPSSPSMTEATSNPYAARTALLETKVASLWRELQRMKERDKALVGKIGTCIETLNSKSPSGELESVVEEMKGIMAELEGDGVGFQRSSSNSSLQVVDQQQHHPPSTIVKTDGTAAQRTVEAPVSQPTRSHSRAGSASRRMVSPFASTGATSPIVVPDEPPSLTTTQRRKSTQEPTQSISSPNPAGAQSIVNTWATSIASKAQEVDISSTAKAAADAARRMFSDFFDDSSSVWKVAAVSDRLPTVQSASTNSTVVNSQAFIEDGYKKAALGESVRRSFPPLPPSTSTFPANSQQAKFPPTQTPPFALATESQPARDTPPSATPEEHISHDQTQRPAMKETKGRKVEEEEVDPLGGMSV